MVSLANRVIAVLTKRLKAKFWVALSLAWLLASKCLLPADTVLLIPVADTSLREMEPAISLTPALSSG